MTFADHVPLRERLWFHTGGVAEYYTITKSTKELVEALQEAAKHSYPYRVIGSGCNILMSDSGFPGLIIQNESAGAVFLHDRSQVIVESGMSLAHLVTLAVSHGYSGLEAFVGTPGTVGGAVASNILAHGYSISEYVKGATVFDPSEEPSMQAVDRDWFAFGRLTSKLATNKPKPPVVISVLFQLSKLNQATCSHRLKQYQLARKSWPTGENTLFTFSTLLYTTNQPIQNTRSPLPPVASCFVTPKQVKLWKNKDVSVNENNPAFIMNGKMGISRDAYDLIKVVMDSCFESRSPLQPSIHCLGLWDEDKVSESLAVL